MRTRMHWTHGGGGASARPFFWPVNGNTEGNDSMTEITRRPYGWGSQEQNRALKALDEAAALIDSMRLDFRDAILRGSYSSGIKKHEPGELGEMEGTPPPVYRGEMGQPDTDRTGEAAVFGEVDDRVGGVIIDIADTALRLSNTALVLRNMARWVRDQGPARLFPVCKECGRPIEGRVVAGCHRSCYDRRAWQKRKTAREAKAPTGPKTSPDLRV